MKKLTPMKAIAAKCKECIYDEEAMGAGTMLQQIEDCTAPDCALFSLRPVTVKTRQKRRQAEIDAMTPEQLQEHEKRVKLAKERFSS